MGMHRCDSTRAVLALLLLLLPTCTSSSVSSPPHSLLEEDFHRRFPSFHGESLLGISSGSGITVEDEFAALLTPGDYIDDAGTGSGGGSHSIFNLKIKELDQPQFWLIATLMLLFTISIDRLQAFLDYKVQDSESGQMLLKRVYGEFVMFGVVALSIFVGKNFVSFDDITFCQLEFVDIMCSTACCSLIAIVATLFMVFRPVYDRWLHFEDASESLDESQGFTWTRDFALSEFYVTSRFFKRSRRLPRNFVYSVYLKECFVRDCCDIMNVQWDTWLLFTCIASTLWILKQYSVVVPMSFNSYLGVYMTCATIIFVLHVMLASHIRAAFVEFLACIPAMVTDPEGEEHSVHPKSVGWAKRSRWAMQILALANTFLLAGFLMHGIHTINIQATSWAWYFIMVFPLSLNIFLVLPAVVYMLCIVEAFYGNNPEALDAVLTQVSKLDEDLRYVCMLWHCKGAPHPPNVNYDLPGFLKALSEDFQLHVSDVRGRRIFEMIDLNEDGFVTTDEFLAGLRGDITGLGSRNVKRLAQDIKKGIGLSKSSPNAGLGDQLARSISKSPELPSETSC